LGDKGCYGRRGKGLAKRECWSSTQKKRGVVALRDNLRRRGPKEGKRKRGALERPWELAAKGGEQTNSSEGSLVSNKVLGGGPALARRMGDKNSLRRDVRGRRPEKKYFLHREEGKEEQHPRKRGDKINLPAKGGISVKNKNKSRWRTQKKGMKRGPPLFRVIAGRRIMEISGIIKSGSMIALTDRRARKRPDNR